MKIAIRSRDEYGNITDSFRLEKVSEPIDVLRDFSIGLMIIWAIFFFLA